MPWEISLMTVEEAVIYWWVRTGILFRYRNVLLRRTAEAVAAGNYRKADRIISEGQKSVARAAANAD